HQDHVGPERDHAGGADTERRVADLEAVRRNTERRSPTPFVERIGREMHPGSTREWLDRDPPEREAIARLTKDLSGAAVVMTVRTIEEARKRDRTVGIDRVPRIGAATAQPE